MLFSFDFAQYLCLMKAARAPSLFTQSIKFKWPQTNKQEDRWTLPNLLSPCFAKAMRWIKNLIFISHIHVIYGHYSFDAIRLLDEVIPLYS